MQYPISICSISSISPLGSLPEEIWKNYKIKDHFISHHSFSGIETVVAFLPKEEKEIILKLRKSSPHYKHLDDSVLYSIYASRMAIKEANWSGNMNFGVNIGSSRGATALFEKYHKEFLETQISSTLSSPTTTLGNVSSWVAHDLQTKGPEISHSITCSTGLHALLNGVAWIQSGFTNKFLVGGSEAPLTPFTIAQMKALKIYAPNPKEDFPCRALDLNKTKNTMFLGEGAAVVCLEKGIAKNALATIIGIGYATEPLKHNISISSDADCFQRSMKMALKQAQIEHIDAVVMHAPGTIKGDQAEYNAIKTVFSNNIPALTTNKWKIGHTFAASGILNLELAILMMQHQEFISVPYIESANPDRLETIMVNAVGFGGNAVSILIQRKK